MKCLCCKHGTLRPGRTIATVEQGATVVIVRHAPAGIYDTCGDYLDTTFAGVLEPLADTTLKSGVRLEDRTYGGA